MAKVQMEAALHKGVSWGMAGDDQVCSLYPPLNKPASLLSAIPEGSHIQSLYRLLSRLRSLSVHASKSHSCTAIHASHLQGIVVDF